MRTNTVQDSHSRSSSNRNLRLALVALVAFIGVLLLNGGAQAFWSAGGSGTGNGGSGTVQAVTLSPGTSPAASSPAGTRDVVLTVSNPNLAEVSVRSLALDTSQGTNGFSVDAGHAGCSVAALSFADPEQRRGRLDDPPEGRRRERDPLSDPHERPLDERHRLQRLPGRHLHCVRGGRPVIRSSPQRRPPGQGPEASHCRAAYFGVRARLHPRDRTRLGLLEHRLLAGWQRPGAGSHGRPGQHAHDHRRRQTRSRSAGRQAP